MKKITFGIVVLMIGLSFGVHVPSVSAVETSGTGTLTAQEAANLQQQINVLKNILATLQAQAAAKLAQPASPATSVTTSNNLVAAQTSLNTLKSSLSSLRSEIESGVTSGNRATLNASLEDIKTNLVTLNNSLAKAVSAPTETKVATNPSPVATSQNTESPALAPSQPMTENMPAFQSQILGQDESKSAPSAEASVAKTTKKSLPWPASIVVIVLAVGTIVLAWMRSKKGDELKPVPVKAITQQGQYQMKEKKSA